MALTRPALAAAALLALACASAARASAPATPQIVIYESGVADPPAQTRARAQDLGFTTTYRYRHAVGGFAARLTSDQIARLREDPAVAAVVPDREVRADSAPLAAGETLPAGVLRIGAAAGGIVREASRVAVAELDTGVDLANPDLNVAAGVNCVDPSQPPMDDNGHGTQVAGTIGARNDGEGVVGVAPGTLIYAVKVLGSRGDGRTSAIICGLDWVAAHAQELGIGVVNMSLGGRGAIGTCDSDPERSAVCAVTAAGATVVAAAGNESDQISAGGLGHVPAAYPEVLAVTAMIDTDGVPGGLGPDCQQAADDTVEPFSNYAGPDDMAHTIAAPGGCVLSTKLGGGTAVDSGTSMAAPHVAAAAALCIDEAGVPGACSGQAPADVIATLRDEAHGFATAANGFAGDPLHQGPRYYGYLLRAEAAPVARTGDVSAIADNSATVAGTVDANGGQASWWFELGTGAGSYALATPAASGDPGADPVRVQEIADGLEPGTTYHYRVALDVGGWIVHGGDRTFTTTGMPPPDPAPPPPDAPSSPGQAGAPPAAPGAAAPTATAPEAAAPAADLLAPTTEQAAAAHRLGALAAAGIARLDRRRGRVTVSLVCRGDDDCAGALELRARGGAVSHEVRLRAGGRVTVRLRIRRGTPAALYLRSRAGASARRITVVAR